jgi:hypothetical protein
MKRVDVDNTKNLDLNTTAKRADTNVVLVSPYMEHSTFSVLVANLAFPIGSFDLEKELLEL